MIRRLYHSRTAAPIRLTRIASTDTLIVLELRRASATVASPHLRIECENLGKGTKCVFIAVNCPVTLSWLTNKELVGFCIPIHCGKSAVNMRNICNMYKFVKGDTASGVIG